MTNHKNTVEEMIEEKVKLFACKIKHEDQSTADLVTKVFEQMYRKAFQEIAQAAEQRGREEERKRFYEAAWDEDARKYVVDNFGDVIKKLSNE